MMALADFLQLVRSRYKQGTLYDSNRNVSSDVAGVYERDSKNLKNQFFEATGRSLDEGNFRDVSEYLALLMVDSFEEAGDRERFQKMTMKAVEKLEGMDPAQDRDVSELANYVWALLDIMLHSWVMNNEESMMGRLRQFKSSLKKFEHRYNEDVELLYQKLGHFGVQ